MILDNETQRSVILQALDAVVPLAVRAATPDALQQLAALVEVGNAVRAAQVAPPEPEVGTSPSAHFGA